MLTTSLSRIRTHSPCTDGWSTLLTALGKTEADDEPLAIEKILETNGIDDALWALRAVDGHQGAMLLYACYCAKLVLPIFEKKYPNDKRPRQAIETTEQFAYGKATEEELEAASSAAGAAWEAAVAARAAAGAAAGAAARVAERAAAWAAWAALAARVAAGEAEGDAEVAGAALAAREAALAAWDAAGEYMQQEFIRLCRLEGEYAEVGR